MSNPTLDVLIIGAGPVGLTLACELRRYGLAVRIVDMAPVATDKSRALVVWPRTMEHLDRMGIAQAFADSGIHATEGNFYQGEELLASIPLDAVETPFPYGLMIPQDQTERLLTEHLASLGTQVERSTTFQSLTEGGDHVTATLTLPDGSTEAVTARWLVGCDGAHSPVRHAIGAQFTGVTLPSDWVLADFHQHDERRVTSVEMHLHTDGVLAIFPIPPDRLRVIANTASGADAPGDHNRPMPEPTIEQIQNILDTRGGKGITIRNPVWLSGFHINERKVADYRCGSVFLAGDAAHVHSPAGGQGMNTGMQDAFNLAWKLAMVCAGHLTPEGNEMLLSSYSAERSPVAEDVLKGSGFLIRMATLDNRLLRGLRNQAIHLLTGFEAVQHAFAREISEIAVEYPKTELNEVQGKHLSSPKPGERAPLNSNARPVSVGGKPVFTLFAPKTPNTEQLLACYPDLLDPVARPPFGEDGIWLVRPDGYAGFAGDRDSWPAADAYLGRLMWPQKVEA